MARCVEYVTLNTLGSQKNKQFYTTMTTKERRSLGADIALDAKSGERRGSAKGALEAFVMDARTNPTRKEWRRSADIAGKIDRGRKVSLPQGCDQGLGIMIG